VVDDYEDEALLELVLSAFGEVDWPTAEVCPFFFMFFCIWEDRWSILRVAPPT
jgi:hypothetical protein